MSAEIDIFSRIAKRVVATARWVRGVSIGIKVVLVLGGGAFTGVGKLLPPATAGAVPWPALLSWIGIVSVFSGGVALLLLDRDQSAALAEAAEAIDEARRRGETAQAMEVERDRSEDFAYRQARLAAVATALREVVEEILVGGSGTDDAQLARLGQVLDVLVSQKAILFAMDDEQWNFAVYLHNSTKNELVCAACRRPTRAASDAPHRSIAPGAGHVGKVFAGEREAVADDSSKPEYRDMFDMSPSQGGKPDDAMVYRSIASVPIRLGEQPPLGVLVATSDRPGRFRPRAMPRGPSEFDTVEPLRVCAAMLAIVMATSNLVLQPKQGAR